ncbi:uncharacterized protein LOC116177538 [Photinus pyralis]|uniref:uncharacterized protein LOC116177538 n=1 Tax=Photinus pyralis TaxID=7054 RepID=UPI0012675257|nr:uncharacterized protein LOC116177538 [Photinus pyralis]
MKTAILAFMLFSACSAFKFKVHPDVVKSWAGVVTPYSEECAAETNVNSKEQFTAIFSMNFPDTHEFHCFTECILRRWGIYDPETGALDLKRFEDSAVGFNADITQKCYGKSKHIVDHCEKIFSAINCVITNLFKDQ